MIKTYTITEFNDAQGLLQIVVDPTQIKEDGSFYVYEIGTIDSPFKLQGFTFIIDTNTAEQIEKLKIVMNGFTPVLEIKEGETFEEGEQLSTIEQKIKALEEELEKEKAKINEQL